MAPSPRYPAGSRNHHEADRWVAASAIWLGIPLVTHDTIFAKVKDLTVVTKPGL
jgi:predicted nucleic acid-binding protein